LSFGIRTAFKLCRQELPRTGLWKIVNIKAPHFNKKTFLLLGPNVEDGCRVRTGRPMIWTLVVDEFLRGQSA
jgi:hypothetical protein